MAIIKCPECGRDVSNKAEKCIHCGYPLHQAAAAPQNPGEADSKNRINLDDPGYNIKRCRRDSCACADLFRYRFFFAFLLCCKTSRLQCSQRENRRIYA